MRRRHRSFTLLEITIALVILSLLGAIIGREVYGVVRSYQFRKEVNDLYQTLKVAQMVAISYETDLTVSFQNKKGKWVYHLQMDEPLKGLDRKEHALKHITAFLYDGKKRQKAFALTINPSGRIEPLIKLTMCHGDEKKILDLKTPIQILLKEEKTNGT